MATGSGDEAGPVRPVPVPVPVRLHVPAAAAAADDEFLAMRKVPAMRKVLLPPNFQSMRKDSQFLRKEAQNYSALVKGTSKLTIGRAFMIGGARKGKSATTDSILNNDFKPGPSTHGVAIHNTACCVGEDSRGDIHIRPVESQKQQLLLMSRHAVRDGPSTLQVDGDERRGLRKVAAEMLAEVVEVTANLRTLAFIEFWDTAGQLPCQALHTTFLRSERTVYLIVFHVMDKLDDLYLDVTTMESGQDIPPQPVGLTNFDVMDEWLHTVLDSVSGHHGDKPMVFLVGTHCDQVEEAVLTQRRDEIWKRIKEKPYRLLFTRECDSSFFFVNNTKSGKQSDDQDEGSKQLRKAVLNAIQSSCERLEPIPNRWLPFTAFVHQMSGNDSKIFSYDHLEMVVEEEFGVGDKDFDAMLRFHDNLGHVLLSSDDSSKFTKPQHVVMDVQWLTSAAGVLLAACPEESERAPCDEDMYADFSRGIVSEEFAVHRWNKSTKPSIKDLASTRHREDRTVFFRLMVKHCLAYEVPEASAAATAAATVEVENESQPPWRKFLFPCVVMADPPDSLSESPGNRFKSPPIHLRRPPRRGCVQRRHYASLVTKCLQVLKPDEPVLGSSAVELRYKGNFWLHLRYDQESIVIHLEIDAILDAEAELLEECSNVVSVLDDWMKTTRPAPNLDYFAICECQPVNSSASVHYTPVSGDGRQILRCVHCNARGSRNAVVSLSVIDCWLQHVCQGKVDFNRHCKTSETDRYMSSGPALAAASDSASVPVKNMPEMPERSSNPWRHDRFVMTTDTLLTKLTEIGTVRSLCYAHRLIAPEARDELCSLSIPSRHNEKLMHFLEVGTPNTFGKFREIVRHISLQRSNVFADILEKWESIGPPPEDYVDLKNQLARSSYVGRQQPARVQYCTLF